MSDKLETASFTYDGKRYFVRAKTKEEALKRAALKEDGLRRGEIARQKMTVRKYWPEYIDTYHANASDYTQRGYNSMFRMAIEPYIGSMQIKDIRQSDIQRLYNYMNGKSLSYVRMVKILLTGFFNAAIGDGLAVKNHAATARLPKAEAGERRALTDKERKLFLEAASGLGDRGLFFLVIYYCGLRPSEVARIQGADIDRKRKVLTVRGTKTKAANRVVPIPDALTFPDRDGDMFLTERGMPPQRTAWTKWWWKVRDAMSEINGEPIDQNLTAYCLRHDYCTRLQEADVPIDVARRLMGHSSIEMTSRIYTHHNEKSLETARKLINAYNQ